MSVAGNARFFTSDCEFNRVINYCLLFLSDYSFNSFHDYANIYFLHDGKRYLTTRQSDINVMESFLVLVRF